MCWSSCTPTLGHIRPSRTGRSSWRMRARDVRILGVVTAGTDTLTYNMGPGIRVELRNLSPRRRINRLRYIVFCLRAIWATLFWRPAWVYCSDIHSTVVGVVAIAIPGIRVLYHEMDGPPRETPGIPALVMRWARRILARRANLIVVPNDDRLGLLVAGADRPAESVLVWNCPLRRDIPEPHRDGLSEHHPIRVLYHGTIGPELGTVGSCAGPGVSVVGSSAYCCRL